MCLCLGKHFINEVADPVQCSLRSSVQSDPSVRLIAEENASNKVLLLSGGGSGHEPAHSGYLGDGMLDIVAAGNIFASPFSRQVLAGLTAVEAHRGYVTGDKLNFGLAAQKARMKGLKVDLVYVGDDVLVKGKSAVGQRGLAGVVFVHKVAGALASQGAELKAVAEVARKASHQMASAAASLDRRGNVGPLVETVANILDMLLGPNLDAWYLSPGRPVAVMVNNLGGLSVLEISVIAEEVLSQLQARGLVAQRSMFGTFVTSLDSPGFSLTLLGLNQESVQLLDAPTTAPAWPRAISSPKIDTTLPQRPVHEARQTAVVAVSYSVVMNIIGSIHKAVKEDEPRITEYDTIAGDGDCGETLINGVNGLVQASASFQGSELDLASVFRAIYAIYLNALALFLEQIGCNQFQNTLKALPLIISDAASEALDELCKYTTAREGHRALMDALIPFISTFGQTQDFPAAFQAAVKGAERTRDMQAVLGKASYVGKELLNEKGGIPDPEALGVVSILRGMQVALSMTKPDM
ncbi:DAK1/DegV-like protein [Zopfia rhizophila CBS 207.26]|uniref:DAK1/DegV-like protein n=1 Tax=Zopfia rhizophila CBS 207.26 TaxID=1314779 RepID=A0A6A6DCH7_9PEZI|nr:DAK1/DegV-like protein [Zopfia rhizophila CBS 207.26]